MQNQNPSHVAIIGCGFTGTTTLYQLVQKYPVKRITIFESSGNFGPGFPYQSTESKEYLLNNTNDTMCLDPANRRAFVEWLQRHPHYSAGLDEKASMPRNVYGEFLQDVIARASAEAARRGIQVDFIAEEAVDLEEQANGGVAVSCESGTYSADIAILATGRCPDRDLFEIGTAKGGHYFPTHMPGTKLNTLPQDAVCHVLGASLSAYDVVNQLFAAETGCEFVAEGNDRLRYVPNENRRRVVLCSRSGRLRKVQSRSPCPVSSEYFSLAAVQGLAAGQAKLEQIFELLTKDAELNGVVVERRELADPYAGCETATQLNQRAIDILSRDIDAAAAGPGSTANFIVDYLDAVQMTLWDAFALHEFPPEEELRLRSKYESALLSYAAPCPLSTAQKVLALMQSGHLQILHGVRAVSVADDRQSFRIEHGFGTDEASYLVNATGAVDRSPGSDRQSALVGALVRKGVLRAYRLAGKESNGIAVDMRTFQSECAQNVYVANMFLWGPGLYVSSAIMMASIVERLLESAFPE